MSAATIEGRMEVPQEDKNRTTYDPAIFWVYIQRKQNHYHEKIICTPMFIVA